MGNIRRSRGYSYEYSLVKRINLKSHWNARRLGGSSTGFPDIVAVNNKTATILSIEAKSGTGDNLYIPQDQIERCFSIATMFSYYKEKHVILAFKFMRKKRITKNKETIYEKRKLLEYYKNADQINKRKTIPVIKCTYEGKTYSLLDGKTSSIDLPDYNMPF